MPQDTSLILRWQQPDISGTIQAMHDRKRKEAEDKQALDFQRKQQEFQERQMALQENTQKAKQASEMSAALLDTLMKTPEEMRGQVYASAAPKFFEMGFTPGEDLDEQYSPRVMGQLHFSAQKGMSIAEQNAAERNRLDREIYEYNKRQPKQVPNRNKEELAMAAAQGDRDAALALGLLTPPKEATPPNPMNGPDTVTTAEGVMQWDGEAKKWVKIGDRPPSIAQPRDERLVQIMGPQGTPIWVRESEAVGQPAAQAARAVTGQERNVLSFYNRAKEASETIATPDTTGSSLEDRVAKSGKLKQVGLEYLPNFVQPQDYQAYRQAQRAFTEARLRKESGAAIPDHEYENDAKTYFAQPGDAGKTIDQKRKAREKVLDGLKFSSGKAYEEYYGEPSGFGKSQKPSGPVTVKGRRGETYTFPNQEAADGFKRETGLQ